VRPHSRLTIEYLPLDDLKAAPHNSRTHTNKQKALIAKSIKRFGMVTPVAIDAEGQLIYGHARVEAARLAGLDEVPVVTLEHLSPDERRAYS